MTKSSKHFKVLLTTDTQSHLKLYFYNISVIPEFLCRVHQAQGFASRLDQYEELSPLPETILGESKLVRHKTS